MSGKMITILFAEDDTVDRMAFRRFIKAASLPYHYHIASSCAELDHLLQTASFDVAIVNPELCHEATFEVLSRRSDMPKIMTSGSHSERLAEQAEQAGASAYFIKDLEGTYLSALPSAIELAVKRRTV